MVDVQCPYCRRGEVCFDRAREFMEVENLETGTYIIQDCTCYEEDCRGFEEPFEIRIGFKLFNNDVEYRDRNGEFLKSSRKERPRRK